MKFLTTLLKVISFWMILCVPVFATEITVAAAANLQFTIEEIKTSFEKETGDTVKIVTGASGKLTTQIENGAPFDVFMSADEDYPKRLFQEGLTVGEPKVYAYGALVLWTLKDIDLSQGLPALSNDRIQKIAIATPKAAPYGKQAVNAMKSAQLYPSIESKLVYGESIAQVNQFITTQAVDVGFTAKSVVLAPNLEKKGKWIDVDPSTYTPIAQAVVLLKQKENDAAKKFTDYLFSRQAQEIFQKYGYKLP